MRRCFGLFAAIAATLAAIGIYGVIAYSVAQRRREIGIRMALGARRVQVLGLVLRQSLLLTAIGILTGIAGAAMVARYLESMLFGLTPLDPATWIGVSVPFAIVAAVAAYVPARRATAIDPVRALRAGVMHLLGFDECADGLVASDRLGAPIRYSAVSRVRSVRL